MPFSGKLSLKEAVARGLEYNLGSVGLSIAMRQAHGQTLTARSALLPNLNGTLSESVQQTDLKAQGLRFSSPFQGIGGIPSIVGPFNYFDLRARLTQTVADFTALNNYRSAKETLHGRRILRAGYERIWWSSPWAARILPGHRGGRQSRIGQSAAGYCQRPLSADRAAAHRRPSRPDRCQQERGSGADAKAAHGFFGERSGEAENQSGPPDRPRAERALRIDRTRSRSPTRPSSSRTTNGGSEQGPRQSNS